MTTKLFILTQILVGLVEADLTQILLPVVMVLLIMIVLTMIIQINSD